MNWLELNSKDQLEKMKAASFEKPQLIFKHSPMCPISRMAFFRMKEVDMEAGLVNVLGDREISRAIEADYGVKHESPQVLLIKDGESVHDESHGKITAELVNGWLLGDDGKAGE